MSVEPRTAQTADTPKKNRQGNDVSARRSTTSTTSSAASQRTRSPTSTPLARGQQLVTEVAPAGPFWEAETEHQDYLERFPNGYTCHFVRPGWKLPRRAQEAVR
jgi:peptide-methionine (S)-S-oxide reductase